MSRWLVFTYAQAAPFSLRLSVATTAASVSALVPSPACFKLGLVDATFQLRREEAAARRTFDLVKGREVRVRTPDSLTVQKTFGRVLVPWERPKEKGADASAAMASALRDHGFPFKRTISFTEIVYWSGPIEVALDASGLNADSRDELVRLAWCVRYLGKRGSLVQPLGSIEAEDASVSCARGGFCRREDLARSESDWPAAFIQRPGDDLGPQAEFDRVSVASAKTVRKGGVADLAAPAKIDRFVGLPFLLPLRLVRTGKSFAWYVRALPATSGPAT